MNVLPIWRDYSVRVTGKDVTDFELKADGVTVYKGRVYKRPGADAIDIRVNDICADYIRTAAPAFIGGRATLSPCPVFNVWTDGQAGEDFSFLNNWSFDRDYTYTEGLSFPVSGVLDARQYVCYTVEGSDAVVVYLEYSDGHDKEVNIPVVPEGGTDAPIVGTVVFNLEEYPGVFRLAFDYSVIYEVQKTCARYALHYVNAYGGWESFLVQGKDKATDTYTRKTMQAAYDNAESSARGVDNYLNEIERALVLYTGYMDDESSQRMHHLLGSTNVILEDIEQKRVFPVVVTDSAAEYKTYKNNGGQLVRYAINVKISQNMERR